MPHPRTLPRPPPTQRAQFGTGRVSGYVSKDVFSIGNLALPDQLFAEIFEEHGAVFKVWFRLTSLSLLLIEGCPNRPGLIPPPKCLPHGMLQYTQFSGIVGMGIANLAQYGINPVFDGVVHRGLLDEPQFSFYFSQSVRSLHLADHCCSFFVDVVAWGQFEMDCLRYVSVSD